jgi:hypothetical protein
MFGIGVPFEEEELLGAAELRVLDELADSSLVGEGDSKLGIGKSFGVFGAALIGRSAADVVFNRSRVGAEGVGKVLDSLLVAGCAEGSFTLASGVHGGVAAGTKRVACAISDGERVERCRG